MINIADQEFLQNAQSLLDAGVSPTRVSKELGVHHSKICRLINIGDLEVYRAYDEFSDRVHLYQNFEWLWEEDYLEELCREAYEHQTLLNEVKDADYYAVGRYVLENYKGIKQYLIKKSLNHLLTEIFIKCVRCEDEYSLDEWYVESGSLWGINNYCKKCRGSFNKKYFNNNPEVVFANNNKRRVLTKGEDFILSKDEYITLRKSFYWKCALSNEDREITIDHFIPLSWEFFTHHKENLIPLSKRLNSQKKNLHPIHWAKSYGIDFNKIKYVIEYLAYQNKLSTSEYLNFINWCHINKGKFSSLGKYPIEIWREEVGIHLPLPKYATNKITNNINVDFNEGGADL